jgi:superfamily II DNA or RNA helicase
MSKPLAPGLYERLIDLALERELRGLDSRQWSAETEPPDSSDRPRLLARYVAELLHLSLRAHAGKGAEDRQLELVRRLLDQLVKGDGGVVEDDRLKEPAEVLRALIQTQGLAEPKAPPRPGIPLSQGDLLVNARGEPGLAAVLQSEIASADRIDLLCAFIKWNGLRLLEAVLRQHLEQGKPLRVLTTTYIGATEGRAIDLLSGLGAEVKVSYDTRTTRLHAKAWFFHRESGFSTAYVGSSNLSTAAMLEGLEWNVRLSQVETPAVLDKFRATFEGYWQGSEFEQYAPERDRQRLDEALALARGGKQPTLLPSFELRPYAFQVEILDKLRAERERHGRHRNLVVAATGTGKTIIAAFDYKHLAKEGAPPRLLFVAHRREILTQSLGVFRSVLRDGAFGELYVDGQRPEQGRHVFASIQALTHVDLDRIPRDRFDVVIVDEFHHAEAPTYRRLLEHLQPRELLGLTATPERSDGESVVKWFDGRIAAELRLWEALERNLLSPFQYFGVSDQTDLSRLRWTRGGYDLAQLENLYTATDRRLDLVLKALRDRVLDTSRMRALGFCVSVAHARYMAARFTDVGIPARAVSAETGREEREESLRLLKQREINALFAVDLFNEGVDVPEIDTVILLRPTESATVFLQQLGRGLRLVEGKDCLTVLDFIGQQHNRFRFDLRLRALTGASRGSLTSQIRDGFQYLPAGCSIQLDRVARSYVLDNVRNSLVTRLVGLVDEVRALSPDQRTLAGFLKATDLELEDVYRRRGWSWTGLRAAGHPVDEPGPAESELSRALPRLLHLDDPEWLASLRSILDRPDPPAVEALSAREQRVVAALHFALWSGQARERPLAASLAALWQEPAIRREVIELLPILEDRARLVPTPLAEILNWDAPVPLAVHCHYRRDDILAAFGLITPEHPHGIREGVAFDQATKSDLFFVTLQKTEKHYSPTTRYRDYAISPELFHWESQSTTSVASRTGQRYLRHREQGTHILLFVRETRREDGSAQPYVFLGPADYVTHSSERPIAITWRLRTPMPPDLFQQATVAVG